MSNETTLSPLAIGDAMRAKALSFAARTGTAIDLVVVKAADAKHEFSLGPINLYRAIKANLTEEEIDDLPFPGSKWNEPAGTLNNNADICQWKDPSKPDGKAKEISFYVVWADGTPEGAHVCKEIEWTSRINDPNMKTDDIPETWKAKYANNPQSVKKRRKYLEGRRATVRKAYKDTVRLLWQLDMVNEMPGVAAHIDDDANEATVTIVNKASIKNGVASEWKVVSVGAFLKMNAKKASETGGTYLALEGTVTREKQPNPTPGSKPGELKLNAVATPETSDKVAAVWLSYLDKVWSDKSGQDYTAFLKHLTGQGGGQAVLALGDIRKVLNELFQMDNIQSIYNTQKDSTRKAA